MLVCHHADTGCDGPCSVASRRDAAILDHLECAATTIGNHKIHPVRAPPQLAQPGLNDCATKPLQARMPSLAGDSRGHVRLQCRCAATSNRFLPVKRLVFSPFIDFSAAFRTEPPYALISDTLKTGFVRPILEYGDSICISRLHYGTMAFECIYRVTGQTAASGN